MKKAKLILKQEGGKLILEKSEWTHGRTLLLKKRFYYSTLTTSTDHTGTLNNKKNIVDTW